MFVPRLCGLISLARFAMRKNKSDFPVLSIDVLSRAVRSWGGSIIGPLHVAMYYTNINFATQISNLYQYFSNLYIINMY
jgi:hypothetical protein